MAVIGEVDRFLDSGVAAADHRHLLPPEKETVAGRAGGNARSAQLLPALQPQPARRRARRDHQRVADIDRAAVANEAEKAGRQDGLDDEIGRAKGLNPINKWASVR